MSKNGTPYAFYIAEYFTPDELKLMDADKPVQPEPAPQPIQTTANFQNN
jgi:hypothetical protein